MSMRKLFNNPHHAGFISLLLALLGLGSTGCYMPLMYGTPNADWRVKGKVVDEDNHPISGLQVVLGNRFENSADVIYDVNYSPLDTLLTAGDGSYCLERNSFPVNLLDIHIQDIDGDLNGGEFEDAHLVIRDISYDGGKGWYEGHADIDVPDIILKKKQK